MATNSVIVTNGKVSFRNLIIDQKARTFQVEFAFIEGRKKKFNYQQISGNVTVELLKWFSRVFDEKIDGIATGKQTTAFKLWLQRNNIEYKPGIIRDLQWTCDNRSENFDDCPFRLTISPMYDTATLALVSMNKKKVVSVTEDLATGNIIKKYDHGQYKYMKRTNFRRLEIYTQK